MLIYILLLFYSFVIGQDCTLSQGGYSPDITVGNCEAVVPDGSNCTLGCAPGYYSNGTDMTLYCKNGKLTPFEGHCLVEAPNLRSCRGICPGKICSNACLSPLNGGGLLQLDGDFFNSTQFVICNQVQRAFVERTKSRVVVVAPAPPEGVTTCNITVFNDILSASIDTHFWLYYTNTTCLIGEWWNGDRCVGCPEGSYCPGGDRIWPLRGYWSSDERTQPGLCLVENACPGVSDLLIATQRTDMCATESGYTGDFCSSCLAGYYQVYGKCVNCGQLNDKKGYLGALILGVILIVLILSVSVAYFRESTLTLIVHVIIIIQIIVQILGQMSAQVTVSWVSIIMGYLSIVNFDVQFVRPGCSWGGATWVGIFWGTLLIMIFALVMMLLAALLFARCRHHRHGVAGKPWTDSLKRRIVLASQCLFSLCYFQLCMRTFQGLACTKDHEGNRVLLIQKDVRCYTGSHLPIALLIWLFLLPVICGFPLWSFFEMRRASKKEGGLVVQKRREKYGFLYRYIKPQYFWLRLLMFGYNFFFALEVCLALYVGYQLFFAGVIYLSFTIVGYTLWPLVHNWRNYFYCIQGYFISISSFISLSVLREWELAGSLVALTCAVGAYCLGFWYCRRKGYFQNILYCQPVGPWVDPTLNQSAKEIDMKSHLPPSQSAEDVAQPLALQLRQPNEYDSDDDDDY